MLTVHEKCIDVVGNVWSGFKAKLVNQRAAESSLKLHNGKSVVNTVDDAAGADCAHPRQETGTMYGSMMTSHHLIEHANRINTFTHTSKDFNSGDMLRNSPEPYFDLLDSTKRPSSTPYGGGHGLTQISQDGHSRMASNSIHQSLSHRGQILALQEIDEDAAPPVFRSLAAAGGDHRQDESERDALSHVARTLQTPQSHSDAQYDFFAEETRQSWTVQGQGHQQNSAQIRADWASRQGLQDEWNRVTQPDSSIPSSIPLTMTDQQVLELAAQAKRIQEDLRMEQVKQSEVDRKLAMKLAMMFSEEGTSAEDIEAQLHRDLQIAQQLRDSENQEEQNNREAQMKQDMAYAQDMVDRERRKAEADMERQAEEAARLGVMEDCVVCSDPVHYRSMCYLPCQHYYCRACIVTSIEVAVKDRRVFQCCQTQPEPETLTPFLNPKTSAKYTALFQERTTPNPVFCSKARCSTFIPPNNYHGDLANCPKCSTKTCRLCKAVKHKKICQADEAGQRLLELGVQRKWMQCPKCKTLVERTWGCRRVRCTCGQEFCYDCGRSLFFCRGKCAK